ncbi:MAG: class I SAM-dependent methyltransferase [Saprospiraceae bacterium]|nr:class I SAM-dependent methyltransferase [Saprospiraceae bacterium]
MNCRFCNKELIYVMVDLGFSPPSNSFLTKEDLNKPEKNYPLKVMVCHHCWLVQIDEFALHNEIFCEDYIYFSSYSSSWLRHCKEYSDKITKKLKLNASTKVIELASNDGYLLQYFYKNGISVLGIEPSANTAKIAIEKGIETRIEFFGKTCAENLVIKNTKADLLIGNNVLAHVPDINDFVQGLKLILKDEGTITMEFPHLLQLMRNNQFDTIYHEHFSYLSLYTVQFIFRQNGLEIYEVEEIPTHGGSLRIYARHAEYKELPLDNSVSRIISKEQEMGLQNISTYLNFQSSVDKIKNDFNSLLIDFTNRNKKVVAYGAAAKGNTLLNYCGVRPDLIKYIVDASPYKQNKFVPGMHIPVVHESVISDTRPDLIVILPWNLQDEIKTQLSYIKEWGGQLAVPIPQVKILDQ